jgi:anti-anti-sigma regulatory factor
MRLPRIEGAKLLDPTHTLSFEGEVLLSGAGETCERLKDCISTYQEVDVDATKVSEIDISFVQLLVAAFKSAGAAGKRLSVRYPADGPFDQLLQRTGFVLPDGEPLTPERDLWVRISS